MPFISTSKRLYKDKFPINNGIRRRYNEGQKRKRFRLKHQ